MDYYDLTSCDCILSKIIEKIDNRTDEIQTNKEKKLKKPFYISKDKCIKGINYKKDKSPGLLIPKINKIKGFLKKKFK